MFGQASVGRLICLLIVGLTIILLGEFAAAQAAQAATKPRVGWICTGPNSIKVGAYYTPGPGRIRCTEAPCRYVLRHRPWCPARNPIQIIRVVFGPHSVAAIRVAWCESRFYVFSGGRGKYQGPFQVDAGWRRRFAHLWGSGMWQRVRHARAIHKSGGNSFGPWECKP